MHCPLFPALQGDENQVTTSEAVLQLSTSSGIEIVFILIMLGISLCLEYVASLQGHWRQTFFLPQINEMRREVVWYLDTSKPYLAFWRIFICGTDTYLLWNFFCFGAVSCRWGRWWWSWATWVRSLDETIQVMFDPLHSLYCLILRDDFMKYQVLVFSSLSIVWACHSLVKKTNCRPSLA